MHHRSGPIELVAIDMDGTLLDPAHTLTPRVMQAIARARAQGVQVVLASGRPVSGMAPFLQQLGIESGQDYCIACNGAVVQNIGSGQQTVQHLGNRILFQIEGQAFFRAIGPDEVRGETIDTLVITSGEVPRAGAFDLDYTRTKVGQLSGAEGRCNRMLKADDGNAIERTDAFGLAHDYYLSCHGSPVAPA